LTGYEPEIKGNLVGILVSEYGQAGTDMNGDGDNVDGIACIYDHVSGLTTIIGIASYFPLRIDGDLMAFYCHEPGHGNSDMNGDGDADDFVIHLYNADSGDTINLGYALDYVPGYGLFRVKGDKVAFQTYEPDQGGNDLNGDGDALDYITCVYDDISGTTTNLSRAVSWSTLEISENRVVFRVSESGHGSVDLNGDGDALDYVLHVYDIGTGTFTNSELAASDPSPHAWRDDVKFVDNRLSFRVDESAQDNTDLNDDGDVLDDVMHIAELP
jgi:hypothetical protein